MDDMEDEDPFNGDEVCGLLSYLCRRAPAFVWWPTLVSYSCRTSAFVQRPSFVCLYVLPFCGLAR
jgi:hypothetical protein